MPQTVKFVDRPGGTVLLDATPGVGTGVTVGDGGVQAPPPSLRRKVDANPVADGAIVTATAYDLRTVILPLVYSAGVQATTAAQDTARRAAVRTLMRVLNRERFWLELRADGATESRYLYCYRVTDDSLIARLDGLGDRWVETKIEVLADPFAYGPKEVLTKQTLNQANDFRVTIAGSGIKGDVAAPLIVDFSSSDDADVGSWPRTYWLASRVGTLPTRVLVDFNTLTNGTPPGTSTFTANDTGTPDAIGGTADKWGNIANGNTIKIGEGNIISNAGGTAADMAGSYRVWLICPSQGGTPNADDVFKHWLTLPTVGAISLGVSDVPVGQPAYWNRVPAGPWLPGDPEVFDLGVVEVPYGGRPTAVGFDAPTLVAPSAHRVWAQKTAGATVTTARWFDCLMVLPADTTMLCAQVVSSGAGTTWTVDPHSRSMLVRDANSPFPNFANAVKVQYQGQTPYVIPGTDVVVAGWAHAGGVGQLAPSIASSAVPASYALSFTPSYWPAYLTVV